MANFLAIQDPDPERRKSYVDAVRSDLAPIPGLIAGERHFDDLVVLWTVAASAPVDIAEDPYGLCVQWGEGGTAVERLERMRCGQSWAYNGFHAAVAVDRKLGLRVGADLLGFFPVVWWQEGDVCLVGASPSPFLRHPCFQAKLDPYGLVGILLTNGLVNGRLPLAGVTRLAARQILAKPLNQPAKEQVDWQLDVEPVQENFEEAVERVHNVLDRAMRRHTAASGPYSIMLSGGLDSRQVGGYAISHGHRLQALTRGLAGDIELVCAQRVACALGADHHIIEDRAETLPAFFARQAVLDHGASGFALVNSWDAVPYLAEHSQRVLSGLCLDVMIGGHPVAWAGGAERLSKEQFLTAVLSWGVPVDTLCAMLRCDIFGEAVEEVLEDLRNMYCSLASDSHQRAMTFMWTHRSRFHAGATPWVYSFGAWPITPCNDRDFIQTCLSLDAHHVAGRRLQKRMVCRYFPQLARLPLDRNSYDTSPVKRPLGWRMIRRWRRCQLKGGPERRRYYRTFDINSDAWRAVRHKVEPCRQAGEKLFIRKVLDDYLPPPETMVPGGRDTIINTNGHKLVLGSLLWCHRYL